MNKTQEHRSKKCAEIESVGTLKILLWNIEGLKSAMNMAQKDFLQGYDIAILTETFLTENWQHPEFYCINLLAKQGERGRPMGGITALIKPELTPITTTIKQEHTLLTETKHITIISAYFQPNKTAIDIMDEIGQLIAQSKHDKPLIIAGDLNCRIDIQNYKAKIIGEKLQEEGFILLNNPNIPTYISYNGKSTIDIAFIRGPIRGNITPIWTANHTPLRKHIPQEINIQGEWRKTQEKQEQALSRIIDIGNVEEKTEEIKQIETLIDNAQLEEATQALGELLRQAANPRNKRRAKQWFDTECYRLRKEVLESLHQLRRCAENPTLLRTYAEKRYTYKKTLKEKKRIFWEREGKKLVEEATRDPYIALRSRKRAETQYISMKEWETHFDNILNKKGIKDKPEDKQETVSQTTSEWAPLAIEEVKDAINSTKNKKAAGPDRLYNEYIKDTAHILTPVWTKLYNKCIETASIPEQWRQSIIKVLYKGKGDPKDPSKYRGIALENVPFKILTKIITERIKESIDEQLPENQMGFRKGRSTLTAIELLLKSVWEALEEREKFYVVFIDFTKAFDLINRKLVTKKLEEILSENTWTRIISAILQWNEIRISDNLSLSEPIIQSNGVLQGDPLSPLLFILAAEEIIRLAQREGVISYAYADDIAVGSKDIKKLQETINDMEDWCVKHDFEINVAKTEMMVLRNGGRAPVSAEIFIRERKLKIVPDFKYLGITIQTSAKCFTKHVTEKAMQAIMAFHEIEHIRSLSLETAMALFRAKILPILTYGLEIIGPHLTVENLTTLERVKATYIKKAIGVSKTTRSRLVYLLARESFLIEDLRTNLMLPNTSASARLLKTLQEKRDDIPPEFYGTGAMIDRTWTKENFELRHVITRMGVHGFHHLICKNTTYHEPNATCECKLCHRICERYHIELCSKRTKSISEYANHNE